MGRKVHPIGFRLGINKPWEGRWYAEGQNYIDQLHQDFEIRALIIKAAEKAGISFIEIERYPSKIKIVVNTAKPGILIGRKGETVKEIRRQLEELTGKKIDLEIKEIVNPDCDARLVAENIANQITRRISYRRAMKRAIQQAIRQGAEGIKVEVAGRLNGAEMSRSVWLREGRVPLQTLRADIDFACTEALTTYGQIGIKVWIYKGEIMPGTEEIVEETEGVYVSE
ncbi:MAG TPA: 30S ribosomal protein S3 [Anaerolineaceae bacterium]|uniref:Small ribosomal subunit protein uS3 n=1 Tax=Anaerolinea thermophila TaxID=167964 RepID=A0A101FZ16_9CHLR|nr:MAG: 30S ribosomal protein S3 [Anaerolinea thermophila]HAF62921.1 30S ribosomal protein S3 [Anaerolineaceae bacterium]